MTSFQLPYVLKAESILSICLWMLLMSNIPFFNCKYIFLFWFKSNDNYQKNIYLAIYNIYLPSFWNDYYLQKQQHGAYLKKLSTFFAHISAGESAIQAIKLKLLIHNFKMSLLKRIVHIVNKSHIIEYFKMRELLLLYLKGV